MEKARVLGSMIVIVPVVLGLALSRAGSQEDAVSFKDHVAPLISKYCLPCHAEENFNPSELSLDSYAQLMKGGKHGSPVVAGEPAESILMKKLSDEPPFGDRMPLQRRKKSTTPVKRLTPEEAKVIEQWIAEGAKDN